MPRSSSNCSRQVDDSYLGDRIGYAHQLPYPRFPQQTGVAASPYLLSILHFWAAVYLLTAQRCGRQSTILEAGEQICCRVGGEVRTFHFEAPMWTSPVTPNSYHLKSSSHPAWPWARPFRFWKPSTTTPFRCARASATNSRISSASLSACSARVMATLGFRAGAPDGRQNLNDTPEIDSTCICVPYGMSLCDQHRTRCELRRIASQLSHMNNGGDAVQPDWVPTPSDLLVRYDVVNIAVLGERMDTRQILSDLHTELNRINQAIAALEALDGTGTATPITTTAAAKPGLQAGKRRRMSAAGRKRISEATKARWAAKRKAGEKPAATKPAPKATGVRRKMSAASRKKIAEAQRARWAAVKKAKSA